MTPEVDDSVEITTEDPKVRPVVKAFATEKSTKRVVESTRFVRFSSWLNLVAGLAMLISKAQSLKCAKDPNATNLENNLSDKLGSAVSTRRKAEHLVIRSVLHEFFAKEIQLITKQKLLAKGCPLTKLNSITNENGLLRVGGRLSRPVRHRVSPTYLARIAPRDRPSCQTLPPVNQAPKPVFYTWLYSCRWLLDHRRKTPG